MESNVKKIADFEVFKDGVIQPIEFEDIKPSMLIKKTKDKNWVVVTSKPYIDPEINIWAVMVKTIDSTEMKLLKINHPTVTKEELKAFIALMMCSDPWPIPKEQCDHVLTMANKLSAEHGFSDWSVALHAL
jgi:hypothetical protein